MNARQFLSRPPHRRTGSGQNADGRQRVWRYESWMIWILLRESPVNQSSRLHCIKGKLPSRPPHLKRSGQESASGREGLADSRWLYSAPFYWTTECYWALDGAVECVSMALNSVSAMVSMPLSLG